MEVMLQCVTNIMLQDYPSTCKLRMISLKRLPLTFWFELENVLFWIKCARDPPDNLTYTTMFHLFLHHSLRSSSHRKLKQKYCHTSHYEHFYFSRIVRLWNTFLDFDISLSITSIKPILCTYLWNHFITQFDPEDSGKYHFVCPCNV